jgi:hypothetical protein
MNKNIKISWEIDHSPMPDDCGFDDIMNSKDYDPRDWITEHEGDVIDTKSSFWGTTWLIVACKNGKIREVKADDVKIIK